MKNFIKENKLVIVVVLVLLTIVGIFYFYTESKKEQKLAEAKIEKQNKCQKDGRGFDEIFRERKNETTTSSKTIVGDGRFNLISFKGNDVCAYQNNWVEIIVSGKTAEAFVHHRIINVDTQEELASVDWTRKFVEDEWKDNFSEEDTEKTAKFVIIEEATFGTSIIFPNIEEYRNQSLQE